MKLVRLLSVFLTTAFILSAQEPPPLTVAVLDFQTSSDKLGKRGAEAAVLLNARLSASPDLIVVERQELEKILGEQELGLSGTVSPDTAAKVGVLTGAKVLVTGRLFEVGGKFFLVAKIISTETGRVYGETATLQDLGALDKAVEELTGKVSGVLAKRADTLVAKVEDPAVRMERWKALVAGKTLPSVTVRIAEQHLSRAVIDPAAQTEFALTLQQLGFTVIDPSDSTQEPDVRITGEAFSEFGARRGNLVSSLARVEIQVLKKNGELIATDRQKGVAVDLAENIAAKEALENASLKLLDRLLPKLVKAP